MIAALVEYIGRNGKTIVKGFSTIESANEFCKKLEAKNTEYLLTKM